jgi:hydrogenase maturation protein HypF
VVLSGGVFQNELLLSDLKLRLEAEQLRIWTNHVVPPGDGGISLGQAAVAALAERKSSESRSEADSRMTHAT